MAGITAQSATATLAAGSTSVDKTISGYRTKEQIVLGTTGTPTTRLWSMAKPSDSGAATALDTESGPAPVFIPDVEGYYTISCLVDGATTYVLRIGVSSIAVSTVLSSIKLMPLLNAQIPAPALGATIFYSSDLDALARKLPDDSVQEIALV